MKILVYCNPGFCIGGTQSYAQNLSLALSRAGHTVAYLSDLPTSKSDSIIAYQHLLRNGIQIINFTYSAKTCNGYYTTFSRSNLLKVINAFSPDLIFTSSDGTPILPIALLRYPIIDTVHIEGGVNKFRSVIHTIHVSQDSCDKWIGMGGSRAHSSVIGNIMHFDSHSIATFDDECRQMDRFFSSLPSNILIYGLVQRANNAGFSSWILDAFKHLPSQEAYFVLLGGSCRYAEQARSLNLPNFYQFPESNSRSCVDMFYSKLDVFLHGRAEGETWGYVIAEAMRSGLPVISHVGISNGHKSVVANPKYVHDAFDSYRKDLINLHYSFELRRCRSFESKKKYMQSLDPAISIDKHFRLMTKLMYSRKYSKSYFFSPFHFVLDRILVLKYYSQLMRYYLKNWLKLLNSWLNKCFPSTVA